MHRIDSDGSVAGLYSNGTPGIVEATQADADAMNALQEEIAGVIESAGLALVKGNYTQLQAALIALFGSLGLANTWTQDQTVQGKIDSSTVPSTRFLAWRLALGSSKYARVYSVSDASLEITLNAGWNSGTSQWDPDVSGDQSTLFQIDASGFRAAIVLGGTGSFADGSWVSILESTGATLKLPFGATVPAGALATFDGDFLASGGSADFNLNSGAAPRFFRASDRGSLTINPTAGDPSSPQNGDIWYNSTSNTLKVYINGVVRTFTVT